jgi:hypothetical protein
MVEVNPQSKIKTSCKEFEYDLIVNLIHFETILKIQIKYWTSNKPIDYTLRCYNIYVWNMSRNVELTSVVSWLLIFFQNQLSRLFYIFGLQGINIINQKIDHQLSYYSVIFG